MKRYRIIWSQKPTARLLKIARRIAQDYAERPVPAEDLPMWISCSGFLLVRRDAEIEEIPFGS